VLSLAYSALNGAACRKNLNKNDRAQMFAVSFTAKASALLLKLFLEDFSKLHGI